MSFTQQRLTINQRTQIGAESTPGTSVAAGKWLECFDWTDGPAADIKLYAPSGHKYDSTQEENLEWVDGTMAGSLDYNGAIYPASSVFGVCTPVAHGTSTTAKDWIMTPPIVGSVQPQTYSFERGDPNTRAHKYSYGLFTEWGYKLTRKDVQTSGKILARALSDGITMTSSPTAVALAPVVGKHWNVYLDTTSGGLGTTQLTQVMSFEYLFSNVYGPYYALNRANTSFTGHVDLKPKPTVKLMLEADSNGMALLGDMQTGVTVYLSVNAQGNQIASDGPGAVYNTFIHNMAVKVSKPNPFKDDQGLFCCEWELTVVEDPTWNTGQAQTLTITNLITAL